MRTFERIMIGAFRILTGLGRWIVVVVGMWILAASAGAQSDPSTLPRLEYPRDVAYVGGFRLPRTGMHEPHDPAVDAAHQAEGFAFGGAALAMSSPTTLFVSQRFGDVAELVVPELVRSVDVTKMAFATYRQALNDPTENHLPDVNVGDSNLHGLGVVDGRLCGTALIYYDANNVQRRSTFCRSLSLSARTFSGWSALGPRDRQGYVAHWVASIPVEWRSRLAGTAIVGNCCVPIVNRTSQGPSAFAVDAATIGQADVPVTPLLYYPSEHPTLGAWIATAPNPTYSASTNIGGLVLVPGTRTAIYFGATGLGEHCYGDGTADPAKHKTPGPDGTNLCYDPSAADKGSHAYPYRYQAWLYDLTDWMAVVRGQRQPWDVVPYAVAPLDLPAHLPNARMHIGGATFDPSRGLIYLSQMYVDQDGYSSRAIIQAFKVTVPASSTPTTPLPPPPPPPVVATPDPAIAELQAAIAKLQVDVARLTVESTTQAARLEAKNKIIRDALARYEKLRGSSDWLLAALRGMLAVP